MTSVSEERVQQLENRIETLEQRLQNQIGNKDSQPSDQINVWDRKYGPPSLGDPIIGKLLAQVKNKRAGVGMDTNQVSKFLDRKKDRTLEIMKELGAKHPAVVYKSGAGNKASKLMVPSKN